ncbi:MAG: glycoside hydrolase family 16 protein, partial [Anaerolineae bacterium]|nr:glycoside hydrolase family 16 protein [Anaerolineae bacterium]
MKISKRVLKNGFIVLNVIPLIISGLSGCHRSDPLPPAIPGWDLVWHDEFSGKTIDLSKWTFEVNAEGGGNHELQYYTGRSDNAFLKDGVLHIQALEELYTGPEGTRDYTSARMVTRDQGDWTYGRFEVRAKLPTGKGLWPAIWMMPTDSVYGSWAASGEIDIMELLGHEPYMVFGTLHYGGEWPYNTQSGDYYLLKDGRVFPDEFHTFTLEWEPREFRWYVDGELYQTQTAWFTDTGDFPAPFDQRFYIIL